MRGSDHTLVEAKRSGACIGDAEVFRGLKEVEVKVSLGTSIASSESEEL
jgi:hypothetical protein